jgi:cytochrome b
MKVRIWDLPIRLFHWAIVLLVAGAWATHEFHLMDLHILLGEIALGLILFRLIWGVIGSSTARFSGFLKGPRTIWAYVRGRLVPVFGHNPVGGWSAVLMLLLLGVQIGLGLFATDEDGLYAGPLSHHVSYDSARILAHRHETIFYVLLAVASVHILAILYYLLVKRDNLIGPMVTGRRPAPDSGEEMACAPLWRFVLAVLLAAAMTWIVSNLL